MIEKQNEYCSQCQKETEFNTQIVVNKDGSKRRAGECSRCGHKRALALQSDCDGMFHFGKHKGKFFLEVPKDYLAWALSNMNLGPTMRRKMLNALNVKRGA